MKRRLFFLGLFYAITLIALSSCDLFKNDEPDQTDGNKYLVSKTLVFTYPPAIVKKAMEAIEVKYPEAAGISKDVKYGFFVYKINYNTTFKTQNVVASGLVCVPMGTGAFPLLSFQNGTNTLHSEAPSVAYTDSLFILIQSISSYGFIVTLPDYLGFGASESMYHPYLHKASTVQSVTDMFRATKELMKDYPTTAISNEVYLIGYSQGGWATMALKKEIETNLSSEFTLKATSCGAGPYDLSFICGKIISQTNYPMPYFMGYVMNSYIKSGEVSLTYTDIFSSAYAGTNYISDLYDGNKNSDYINSKLTTTVSELFTSDLKSNFATSDKYATLRTALTNNSVTAWKTTSPLLLVHGLGDTFVTPTVSNNIYLDFLVKGTATDIINYVPIPLLDHRDAVIPWGLLTVKWILTKKG
jgi:pimeloyl-ACP methyl ester carboxylesterase